MGGIENLVLARYDEAVDQHIRDERHDDDGVQRDDEGLDGSQRFHGIT